VGWLPIFGERFPFRSPRENVLRVPVFRVLRASILSKFISIKAAFPLFSRYKHVETGSLRTASRTIALSKEIQNLKRKGLSAGSAFGSCWD
jgi:hypothetical protein